MDTFFKMAQTQSVLFLYILLGIACRKRGLFDDHTRGKLTDFTLMVTLPCMVFDSFHMPFDLAALYRGGLALAIAFVMAGVALAAGKVLYRRMPPGERCVMQYGTLVTNSGFAGLPVVAGAYGEEGLFLASLFVIPTRILMWSAGISLFEREGDRWQRAKKVLLNPSIIAVALGLARMVLQLPLPAFVDTAIGHVGDCTSPIAMALVGAILADVEVRDVAEPKAGYLILVRQLALPALCLAGLKLLGVDTLTTGVSVALTGMPIGSTTAILAQKYGADARFASKCVFLSTLSSLVTVPLLTLLL